MPACWTLRLNFFSAISNVSPGLILTSLTGSPARSAIITIAAGATFALTLIAIAAIDWFVTARHERNLRYVAAAGASCLIHLAALATRATATPIIVVTTICFTGRTTVWTALGSIGQTTTCVKLLLSDSEDEFFVAIATNQCLIT
jgi:hypothetical protein